MYCGSGYKEKYLLLIGTILLSGIYLYLSNTILHNILAFSLLFILSSFIVKFNITHPYVWYSGFYSLYSIGYPILLLYNSTKSYGYTKELMVLQWLGLVTFLLVVGPKEVKYSIKNLMSDYPYRVNKFLYVTITLFLMVFVSYMLDSDYTSKYEIISSGSIITFFGMRAVLIYITISMMEQIRSIYETDEINLRSFLLTSVIVISVFIVSAERDIFFRYIIMMIYIYYIFFYKKRHNIVIFPAAILMALLLPLSRSIKYFGLRGEIASIGNNLVVEIIKSEFHTQARNLQVILNSEFYNSFFQGKTFITSIARLFGLSEFSSNRWFNETFFPDRTSGMGFSLVAEGYVNLGYVGVIFMFVFIGMVIKFFYKNSRNSIYYLSAYLAIIPISIYTIRADLHNFVSQVSKHVILVLIAIKILDILVKKYKILKQGE